MKLKRERLKPLSELLSLEELHRRDLAKHERIRRKIFKEFKRHPYLDIVPHETMAQVTMAKAMRDRNRKERRKLKCRK